MKPEDRTREALRAEAERHTPALDGLSRIWDRVESHRQARRRLRAGLAGTLAVLFLVGSGVVLRSWSRGTRVRVVGPAPSLVTTTTQSAKSGVSTIGPTHKTTVSALRFVSVTTGWAIIQGDRNALLRTTDGGRHWQDLTSPTLNVVAIAGSFFLDADHAWLYTYDSGSAASLGAGTIHGTSDGGRTWQAGAAPVSLGGASFDFIDPRQGWVLITANAAGAGSVDLFRTTDGGTHWSEVSKTMREDGPGSTPGGLPSRCSKAGLTFADSTTGWATGACVNGLFFYATHDGGRTWTEVPLPLPPGVTRQDVDNGITVNFSDPPTVSGRDGALEATVFKDGRFLAFVYGSHDAGRTWKPGSLPATPRSPLLQVDLVDGLRWVFTDGTLLYFTHDAGEHWTTVTPSVSLAGGTTDNQGLPVAVGHLQFVSDRDGWAVADDNVLLHTVDGGRRWERLQAGP